MEDSLDFLRYVLETGEDPNGIPGEISPLAWAGNDEKLEMMRLLLEAGARISSEQPEGSWLVRDCRNQVWRRAIECQI